MKQTFKTLTLLVAVVLFISAAPNKSKNDDEKIAVISFETEVIDYGTIIQNSDGERIFTFTNKGDAPLIITNVKTSCGCTVPSYSKEPILPGKTGQLNIKYNTNKLGSFTKTITVISNAEGGNKILKIKGNIIADQS